MYRKVKKLLAALCIMVLVISMLPKMPANAATKVQFKKTYANLYENGSAKGKYTYTLTGVKKGQTVKWSVSGAGKSYVKLKKTSTKVTGSTVSNVLTVKTGGKLTAKNKEVVLTAKVYSSTGKYEGNRVAKGKIKVKPTKVVLTAPTGSDGILYVGKRYSFSCKTTPANATSTNVWTVTDENGVDYSSCMSSTGIFTPIKAGYYTVKVSAKIGSSVIKSASAEVEVSDYMVSLNQTTADQIEVTYSGDVRDAIAVDDFTLKNSLGVGMVIKDMSISDDGKKVTLTMYSNLKDGVTYTVEDSASELSFQASVGRPVELKILTQTATVGKETGIKYMLSDINGVDVTGAYPGKMEYEAKVTNGYLNPDTNKLLMMQVNETGTITLKYESSTDNSVKLEATSVITCVAAQTSGKTNFTLTTNASDPDYTVDGYKDNRKVSIGSTYYAHFRALDTDECEIKYSSIKYESSDLDAMTINNGKITPIRSGNVKVIVTATYAGEDYTYSYDVTIAEAPYLKKIELDQDSVTMSNVYSTDYKKYIKVTAYDQYGEKLPLSHETAVVTDNNSYKQNLVTYDGASDCIVVKASSAVPGTFSYKISVTQDGEDASASLSVVVCTVPSTGTETYELEVDRTNADLSLNSDISSSQYVKVRLAKYRAGVFMNYSTSFTSVAVTKNGYYYGNDLTSGGTTAKPSISATNPISLKILDITSGVCRKAETGTYTIAVQYYSSADKGYLTQTATFTLTDTQDEPKVSFDRREASKRCTTALELAQNCLTPESGTITECTVTAETQPGSKVLLKAGDQVNIRYVTVVNTYKIAGGQEVTVTYQIDVGRTLVNI